MRKIVGVLAHVDAGKTTFSEQILYHAKAIRERGKVDNGTAFLDTHELEKARGITIFSEQARFEYGKDTYYLIDTPGHVDFSSEMERALLVMDYAVIVVSAVEGVQGHTRTVIRLLKDYQKPIFFFINKVDREGADVGTVIKELSKYVPNVVEVSKGLENGEFSTEVAEAIASTNEDLLEKYFETGYEKNEWFAYTNHAIASGELSLAMSGSALYDKGMKEFLEVLHTFTQEEDDEMDRRLLEPFSAIVYKVRYDKDQNRLSFLKIKSGRLKVKDTVTHEESEKVNSIRIYNGIKYETVNEAIAGDLCAVTGLKNVMPGDCIGREITHHSYEITPMLTVRVLLLNEKIPEEQVYHDFKVLEEEDPMLGVEYSKSLHELHVNIMGIIQLEVLKALIKERFGYEVEFGDPKILFKETIRNSVKGYGHFEPLKHYAEVHVKIEPLPRQSGIQFASTCPTDNLTINYQNLVKTHVFEKEHKGVLLGAELTDVRITLTNGRAHVKHTEGGDFRQATYRAIRQGLMKADSILLEPYYKLQLEAEVSCCGRILTDINKLGGTVVSQQIQAEQVIILANGPVRTFMNYAKEFVTFTKGKGSLSMDFAGYEECRETEKLQEEYAYEPDRDVENPASSVFCAKGTGFTVKWMEAENYMHCEFLS